MLLSSSPPHSVPLGREKANQVVEFFPRGFMTNYHSVNYVASWHYIYAVHSPPPLLIPLGWCYFNLASIVYRVAATTSLKWRSLATCLMHDVQLTICPNLKLGCVWWSVCEAPMTKLAVRWPYMCWHNLVTIWLNTKRVLGIFGFACFVCCSLCVQAFVCRNEFWNNLYFLCNDVCG